MAEDRRSPPASHVASSDQSLEPATIDMVPGAMFRKTQVCRMTGTNRPPICRPPSRFRRSRVRSPHRSKRRRARCRRCPKSAFRDRCKMGSLSVIKVLGAGGMGAVCMARDPRLNRLVALKLVHPGLGHAGGSTGAVFVKSVLNAKRGCKRRWTIRTSASLRNRRNAERHRRFRLSLHRHAADQWQSRRILA